jgi:hypothetical protein
MANSTSPLQRAIEASGSHFTGHAIDKFSIFFSVTAAAIALIVMSGLLGVGQGLDDKEPPLIRSWTPFGIGHLFGLLWGQIGYLEELQYVNVLL